MRDAGLCGPGRNDMKDLGVKQYVFPMPVALIATYNEDGTVDVMNMAWGGICSERYVALNLDEDHATSKNLKRTGAFTLSLPDTTQVDEADYFGIDSSNDTPDKFERTGMHAVRSARVDAPIVTEFKLTLECRVAEIRNGLEGFRVLGEIVNVMADESVLGPDGDVDPVKLDPIMYDTFRQGYYAMGRKVGQAWDSGMRFKRRGRRPARGTRIQSSSPGGVPSHPNSGHGWRGWFHRLWV